MITFSTRGSSETMRLNSTTACVWRSLRAMHDFARPEDVVRDQHRAAVNQGGGAAVPHQHPVVVRILAFIPVDEYQVEFHAQRRGDVECRTDVQPDLRAVRAAVEKGLRQFFQLVLHLDGVQFPALFEPCGHRERRIPREGADLEDALRPEHPHEHLQQAPLYMARQHAGLYDPQVGRTVELVQQLLFGRGVVVDVLFERVHYLPQNPSLLNLYDASMASGVSAERASRHSRVNSSCPVPLAVTTLPSRTAWRSS